MARLSPQGLDFIAGREGFETKPYNDSAGHCTVGIGHLLHSGPCTGREPTLTQAEVRAFFAEDIQRFTDGVLSVVRVPLRQNELDALVSFAFSTGLGAFARSTLLQKLNAGDRAAVPGELLRWDKETRDGELVVVPNKVERRQLEARIFTAGWDGGALPIARRTSPLALVATAAISAVLVGGIAYLARS